MPDERQRSASAPLHLPKRGAAPLRLLLQRILIALAVLLAVAMICWLDRDGYKDADGTPVTLIDAFYYATVSVTTTGYGDIIPVTQGSRLLTTLLITPARILFLIILVGTTVEVLVSDTRTAIRRQRWRQTMTGHTIICGYGATGRAAVETMLARGADPAKIVVVERDSGHVDDAVRHGLTAIHGDVTDGAVLREARIQHAKSVLIATARDEIAILATLVARQQNEDVLIAVKVREEENVAIARQSGATSVVVSAGAAGRLLGHAPSDPRLVDLLDDLLSVGRGLDVVRRDVEPEEVGVRLGQIHTDSPIVAVLRGDDLLRFDDPGAETVQAGDQLVLLARAENAGHELSGLER